jgi:hypothetical protein
MTHDEQHAMIVELQDYARQMNRYDQEEFEMFVKRDKDDEDLDSLSRKRLTELYALYVPKRKANR